MFKGILPSKRISSSDFTMLTMFHDSVENAKENLPGPGPAKLSKTPFGTTKDQSQLRDKKGRNAEKKYLEDKDQPTEGQNTNVAFDKLLDDLQIPSTLRAKLIGMDATVKAAMLKSSYALSINPRPTTPTRARPSVRRARSIEVVNSPSSSQDYTIEESPLSAFPTGQVSAHHPSSITGSPGPRKGSAHTKGMSFDAQRIFSRSNVHLPSTLTSDIVPTKVNKDKTSNRNISPTKFCSILSSTSSTQLDVEDVKKLRLMLRNESASWSQDFLKSGGYSALLTRLNEILEVEWREEQHDDQILHELLRCFKALSTSGIGCFALRSSCPTPFVQLVALLYSDKKPGEVATRQLIVELLLILFDLYPPSSLPSAGNSPSARLSARREAWESDTVSPSCNVITLPPPHRTFFSLIRALLLTPAPPPSESLGAPISPHAFIESLHLPRIYKTYLQELSDICRDYFWVFCHPNNTIWILSATDERKVEKPRAPGGMTGGVEFEAMGYFTTHLKLINAIAKCAACLNLPRDHDHSAYRFHSDLFLSGFERIILISRKASTTYYPTLHLELARYIMHATSSGYQLPYTVSRLIGLPPDSLVKASSTGNSSAGPTTPTKRTNPSAPSIPSPCKVEPIKFD